MFSPCVSSKFCSFTWVSILGVAKGIGRAQSCCCGGRGCRALRTWTSWGRCSRRWGRPRPAPGRAWRACRTTWPSSPRPRRRCGPPFGRHAAPSKPLSAQVLDAFLGSRGYAIKPNLRWRRRARTRWTCWRGWWRSTRRGGRALRMRWRTASSARRPRLRRRGACRGRPSARATRSPCRPRWRRAISAPATRLHPTPSSLATQPQHVSVLKHT